MDTGYLKRITTLSTEKEEGFHHCDDDPHKDQPLTSLFSGTTTWECKCRNRGKDPIREDRPTKIAQ